MKPLTNKPNFLRSSCNYTSTFLENKKWLFLWKPKKKRKEKERASKLGHNHRVYFSVRLAHELDQPKKWPTFGMETAIGTVILVGRTRDMDVLVLPICYPGFWRKQRICPIPTGQSVKIQQWVWDGFRSSAPLIKFLSVPFMWCCRAYQMFINNHYK